MSAKRGQLGDLKNSFRFNSSEIVGMHSYIVSDITLHFGASRRFHRLAFIAQLRCNFKPINLFQAV